MGAYTALQANCGGDTLRKSINFRLRQSDKDLVDAIENIDPKLLTNLCRDGLRYMLGLNTKKIVEVEVEVVPITKSPTKPPEPIHQPIQNGSSDFKPKLYNPNPNNRSMPKREQS